MDMNDNSTIFFSFLQLKTLHFTFPFVVYSLRDWHVELGIAIFSLCSKHVVGNMLWSHSWMPKPMCSLWKHTSTRLYQVSRSVLLFSVRHTTMLLLWNALYFVFGFTRSFHTLATKLPIVIDFE